MNIRKRMQSVVAALAMVTLVACNAVPILVADTPLPAADTATPTPTETPGPTATFTVTPSPTATPIIHPLMIEVMRQQTYLGSNITFEEILPTTASYERFIVSYLSEGNKIYAYMTIPRGEKPSSGWPVVVFNHGFIPPNQYRTTERYIAYQDGFAGNGYIVFRSDYRGHGSSEGNATGGYSSPAYTIDVLNALASVKRYPDADPDRIGMGGHSMGGQITLRAMVVSPDIKAGVIWGGVVGPYPDLLEYWRRSTDATATLDSTSTRGRWRRDLLEVYDTPENNPDFWASISPNTYVSDLSGPVQLHHSTTDESVPFILSELLYAEILAVGVPVEFYVYEGDDHDITANFATAMQRSVDFFDTYVKGKE
ncbi:MAG: alpha/beta fold hydrolase [Anaerolineae bacterium]|nr:alpha/beta fold hydrolase [Anaerolineae bacterium]